MKVTQLPDGSWELMAETAADFDFVSDVHLHGGDGTWCQGLRQQPLEGIAWRVAGVLMVVGRNCTQGRLYESGSKLLRAVSESVRIVSAELQR